MTPADKVLGILYLISVIISFVITSYAIHVYYKPGNPDRIWVIKMYSLLIFVPIINVFSTYYGLKEEINNNKKEIVNDRPKYYDAAYRELVEALVSQNVLTQEQIDDYVDAYRVIVRLGGIEN